MRILLVRHGESEGNIDEKSYVEKGDEGVDLTDHGWRQAMGTGHFLRTQYANQQEWPIVYLSTYNRTQQTLSAILYGMNGVIPGQPVLRGDVRLIEKSFGATNILNHPPESVDPDFAAQFRKVSDLAYARDPFTIPNPLGESSKDNLIAVKGFIDGTFARQVRKGSDDFLLVVHGAVIRNFLLAWAHLPLQSRQDILAPGNGDVISIEGEPKNWKIRKIYDGPSGKEVDIDPLNGIRPYAVEDLPPVPEHLRYLTDPSSPAP